MQCVNCGADQPVGKRFCTACGQSLIRACAECGTALGHGDRFCGECGTPSAAPPPAYAAPAAHTTAPTVSPTADPGQRRFVTVLFADIVGFTPFSEGRDAEEVRAMLTRYFDRATEIIERFGGQVDKFIGDAVMAVWGAVTALEDDAERGVRAALELVDAVAALGAEIGVDLTARAGVLSGETSVGSGGNEKGLVVGDLVNTASRLQSIAEPGTVLIGETTKNLVEAAVELESHGEHNVKGKKVPVGAWRAVRVVAGRRGEGRVGGLVAPFTGRDNELRILKDMLAATTRERRTRLISIVGEGGIGKSRLVEEFLHYIDGLADTIYWHHGRSPAYGDGLTFWALGEMVRRRCGIAESDDTHRTMTRLRTTLADFVADGEDRAWLEPRLAGLLGAAPMPTSDRAELFSAWRSFFEHVALRGTTVMVFEDLHWADSGLVEFIDELTARSSSRPILVLTLARPELLDRRPGWGSGRANTMALHLAPLADPDVADLVTGMVPGAGQMVADHVVSNAGGIPLYAVEIVRMLVNADIVTRSGDRFQTVGDLSSVRVPDSLTGVVGARIDQLDPADRSLLQDASVLGQTFTLTGLAALQSGDTTSLEQRLERLIQRELLAVEADPRSPERGQYRFIQSLIREVSYSRMARVERKDKHLAVAAYLEERGDVELAGAVAAHYVGAIEAASESETGALTELAVSAVARAAVRAAELQSHEQAVALALQGVTIDPDAPAAGHLWVLAARSAHASVDDQAETYARKGLEVLRSTGDEPSLLDAGRALATIYNDARSGVRAVEVLRPLVDEAADTTSEEFAKAATELARALMFVADFPTALEYVERALHAAERRDMVPTIADGLITRGTILGSTGRPREGAALLSTALELAEELDLGRSVTRALNNLAYLSICDERHIATELTVKRLEQSRRIGDPLHIFDSLLLMAQDHAENGQWREMDPLVEEAIGDRDIAALSPAYRFFVGELDRQKKMWCGDPLGAQGIHESLVAAISRELDNEVDTVTQSNVDRDRALLALLNGDALQAAQIALTIEDDTPNLYDVEALLLSALALGDGDLLSHADARLNASVFRGKRIEALSGVIEASLDVLSGGAVAAGILVDAVLRLRQVEFPPITALVAALAAKLVGAKSEAGRDLAELAFDLSEEHDLFTVRDLIPDVGTDSARAQAGA